MNRREKVQFIRSSHPQLYDELKAKVGNILEEEWLFNLDEVNRYDEIVREYCSKYCNNILAGILII